MIDHDRLFKELLSTFFVEFIELFLPEVVEYLEADSIVLLDKELFTDVTSGERHEADLVAKAKFKGGDSFFLIHIENQAYSQTEFSKRMFRYFSRLYEKHELPVYPIALFSYDNPKREEASSLKVEFSDLIVLSFNFRAIQLNRLNWRDYINRHNPVASALMSKMIIKEEERPIVKLECLRLLATLRLNAARMQLISGFIDTYLRLNAEEELKLRKELEAIDPIEKEAVMEIVTSWMEEGIQKGIQQGLEQGIEQGLRQGLLEILEERFQTVPQSIVEAINKITDVSVLKELHRKAIRVGSLEQFQEYLSA